MGGKTGSGATFAACWMLKYSMKPNLNMFVCTYFRYQTGADVEAQPQLTEIRLIGADVAPADASYT
jgi:hypothetical protein